MFRCRQQFLGSCVGCMISESVRQVFSFSAIKFSAKFIHTLKVSKSLTEIRELWKGATVAAEWVGEGYSLATYWSESTLSS